LSKKNKKSVDDATSTLQYSGGKIEPCANLSEMNQIEWRATSLLRMGRCHFCGSLGVIVDRFARRGYGKQNYSWKWQGLQGQEDDEDLK